MTRSVIRDGLLALLALAALVLCLALAKEEWSEPHGHTSPVQLGSPVRATPPGSDAARCATQGTGCARALWEQLNSDRVAAGVPALALKWSLAHGSGSCPGAIGHSVHMAATGVLAHDQFPADICESFQTAAENIGEASGMGKWQAIQQIYAGMEAEPYTPGCQYGHHCTNLSPAYQSAGIGIVERGGVVWITEDFATP